MSLVALADVEGPIRYDWQNIQLIYTAGATVTEIAKSLTKDCPESFKTVQNTIIQRSIRYEWSKAAQEASKIAVAHPGKFSKPPETTSDVVMSMAANIAIERKNSYISRVSGFIDKSSKLLEDRGLGSLEDAAMAGKLFEPIHSIARDIHGLNAREPVAALQVNVLSAPGGFAVVQDEPESVVETDNNGG